MRRADGILCRGTRTGEPPTRFLAVHNIRYDNRRPPPPPRQKPLSSLRPLNDKTRFASVLSTKIHGRARATDRSSAAADVWAGVERKPPSWRLDSCRRLRGRTEGVGKGERVKTSSENTSPYDNITARRRRAHPCV